MSGRDERVTVVRTIDDFARVVSVRAIAYVASQDCPFDEEFDGNDLCAMHLLGWIGAEPAGCLRIRFFADFAKLERLAVRAEHRRSSLAFQMVREGLRIAARKGFRRVYGHAQAGLEPFWMRFGARPIGPAGAFGFSGRRYTEMLLETQPDPVAIGLGSDPLMMLRPEGAWDEPGVLERGRPAAGGRDPDGGWSGDVQAAWRRAYRPDAANSGTGFEDEGAAGWINDREDDESDIEHAGQAGEESGRRDDGSDPFSYIILAAALVPPPCRAPSRRDRGTDESRRRRLLAA